MTGIQVSGEVVQGAGVQIADDGTISATASSLSFDAIFGSTPGAFIYRGSASWTALSPGAVGQLLQSGGANGTPSWLAPSAMLDGAFGSTQGDILYRGASSWTVLSPGAVGQLLQSGGASANPSWLAPSSMLDSAFSNVQGSLLYRDASAWAALAHGTAGQVLQSGGASANPSWLALGTAAALNVGTAASDIVQLDASAKLPAVDGSQLTNVPGSVGGQLPATATNDNAAAGKLGEYLSNSASSVSPGTSGTVVNICSITLTPGDWDVSAQANLVGAPWTIQEFEAGLNTVSATMPSGIGAINNFTGASFVQYYSIGLPIIPNRFSVSVSTVVYLVAAATWNAGSGTYSGTIRARRVR